MNDKHLEFTASDLKQMLDIVDKRKQREDYVYVKNQILGYVRTRANSNVNSFNIHRELSPDTVSQLQDEGFKIQSIRDRDGLLITISW